MFIVWGSKWQYPVKPNGLRVEKMCPECDKRGVFFEVTPKKMFTLFWVPISPSETKKSLLECPNCHARFYIQSADYLKGIKDLSETKKKVVIHLPDSSTENSCNASILNCAKCGQRLHVPDKKVKLKITCPTCRAFFTVENGHQV